VNPGRVPAAVIRVVLPPHLRNLAKAGHEVQLDVPGAPTLGGLLDALEERYPVLRGTIRDRGTGRRRAFVRFYACEEDLSNEPADTALPEPVAAGREPLLIIGAMARG
jgi:hypothetical protein